MNELELELLAEVANEIEQDEQEETADRAEFKDRYEDLMACAIDELNDEVLKHKLRDKENTGTFILLQGGKHQVYRNKIPSEANLLSGEEFLLYGFELSSMKRDKSMVNILFTPVSVATTNLTRLIIPFDQVVDNFGEDFRAVLAKYFLKPMDEIEKEVVKLQHEYAERDRQRQIKRLSNTETYAKESSW